MAQTFAQRLLAPQWNPAVKTGSTFGGFSHTSTVNTPQWNPAVKTGSTHMADVALRDESSLPQWNPAVKTGSTRRLIGVFPAASVPQWNPAVKTGSTYTLHEGCRDGRRASMEPGREDREHHRT